MRIIVSGGGTGGHIYPAITVIRTLQEKLEDLEFLYVGTSQGLEADIVPKEGLPLRTVDLQGFKRSLSPANIGRALKAMAGVAKAAGIVKEFKPDVVIGTGGYVCGPVLLAASLMGIPTMIQEQNVVPGITNKILSKFVNRIAVGTPAAMKLFPAEKAVYTGNPIRRQVLLAEKSEGLKEFGFTADKPIVLISGGSRGARSINNAMVPVLGRAAADAAVQYLHVTGKNEYQSVLQQLKDQGTDLDSCKHIRVVPYLYNMPQAMAMADLAVFRAGATGLAELTARGIPSILIPYPYAAENHQEHNAAALRDAGAARMILNRDLNGDILRQTIAEVLGDKRLLQSMSDAARSMGRPQAADQIADMIIALANKSDK